MKKALKKIPRFRTEAAERAFWNSHDSTDYVDWGKARWVRFPNLRASTRTISLRLPEALLDELKALANQRDVPYQSLLKLLLADGVRRERGESAFRGDSGPAVLRDAKGVARRAG
jgi:predicted DNA binding CopG/RHH family protein